MSPGHAPAGVPFSAYHEADIKKMRFEMDMALPVEEEIEAGEFSLKRLGGGDYYKVTLLGSHDFLELTWFSAIGHLRMSGIKMDKSRPSIEACENDPARVESSNDIQTSLYIPVV